METEEKKERFTDFQAFYEGDQKYGSEVILAAKKDFLTNEEANYFLRKVSVEPHSNNYLRELAIDSFWDSIKVWASTLIKHYPAGEHTNLMEAMRMTFLLEMPKYQYWKAKPTTYYGIRLKNTAYFTYLESASIPRSIAGKYKKVQNRINELINNDEPVTTENILAGFPAGTISATAIKNIVNCIQDGKNISLDTIGDGGMIQDQIDTDTLTPEQAALKNEYLSVLKKVLEDEFTEKERIIYNAYLDCDRKISQTLKVLEKMGYTDVAPQDINDLCANSMQRIYNYLAIHKEYKMFFDPFLKQRNQDSGQIDLIGLQDEISLKWEQDFDYIEDKLDKNYHQENVQLSLFPMRNN